MRRPRPVTIHRGSVLGSLAVALALGTGAAHAADPAVLTAGVELAAGDWELLVVPADASDVTLETLFGDDLGTEGYFSGAEPTEDTTWVVYLYDTDTRTYVRPALDDSIPAGAGFWIMQMAESVVPIDAPADLPAIAPARSAPCTSAAGCFEIALATDPGRNVYSMVGAPFTDALELEGVRYVTAGPGASGDPCEDGCDLVEAGRLVYAPDRVFAYDPDAAGGRGAYDELTSGDEASPWTGFWTATGSAADGKSPRMLLPLPAPDEPDGPAGPGTVAGRVTTPDGAPVADAPVVLAGTGAPVATTDADGRFSLAVAAGQERVLRVDSDRHGNRVAVVRVPATGGTVPLELTVVPRDVPVAFAAPFSLDGGSHRTRDGGSVSVPPGGFVTADGSPVLGDVTLVVAEVDVSNPAELAAFPGEFAGTAEGEGVPGPIVSLGTVEYEFRADGQEVDLAPGVEAAIEIPIYVDAYQDGTAVGLGDSIPLWSLDEGTGLWTQEGEGTVVASARSRTGFALAATVDHFTWWNCDVSMRPAEVRVRVVADAGEDLDATVAVGARTTADLGWRATSADTIAAFGEYTDALPVPADVEVCYSALVQPEAGNAATTDTLCATLGAGESRDIELGIDASPDGLALAAEGSADVVGGIGAPVPRVSFGPAGLGASPVSYDASGLPPGVTLRTVDAWRAELVGVPSAAGGYAATVMGTNAEGTAALSASYAIAAVPPPSLPFYNSDRVDTEAGIYAFDLSLYDRGGPATSWELVNPAAAGPGVALDAATGVLSFDPDTVPEPNAGGFGGFFVLFDGLIRATNEAGSVRFSMLVSLAPNDDPSDCGLECPQ